MITRLGAVPVFVSDQEKALEFYRDRLGFVVVDDQQYGDFRWVTVARQKGETEIILFKPVPSLGPGAEALKERIGTWTGIVFHSDDVWGDYERLREKGVRFEAEPTRQGWGGVETWFFDPDGNRFHLGQLPAGRDS
ncbi:MAG TPA: VOC family protein [Blastocatellia bacterium]|nr:VOC family protein [Blastocatellia bacterium]